MFENTSKIYPCWRVYQEEEKLPIMMFQNGRTIDLSAPEVTSMLARLTDENMLMFYEHLYYGSYQPCSGQTDYAYGTSFSVSKNDDGSICVFGNGCLFA